MKTKCLLMLIPLLLMMSAPLAGKTHQVKIYKRQFIPAQINVAPGDTIVWLNTEKRQYHNVWLQSLVKEEPQIFFPGERYSYTFDSAGVFNYICGPHPEMKGVVNVVKEAEGEVAHSKVKEKIKSPIPR